MTALPRHSPPCRLPQRAARPGAPHRPRLSLLGAALAALALSPPAAAALHEWTGAASANWSDAANWLGGVPVGGLDTDLLFDAAQRAQSFHDIAGGLALRSLTLGAQALAPGLSGGLLRFQGEGSRLRMLSDGGHGRIANALQLDSGLALDGGRSVTSQLFLEGAVSGSGGLDLASGIAVLAGANSFSGAVSVASGARLGLGGAAGLGNAALVSVASGGEVQLVGSGQAVARASRPLRLAGLLSSSARNVPTLFGQGPGGVVSGNLSLDGDASVLAFNGSLAAPVTLLVDGPVDRAGRTLTLRTGGAGNTLQLSKALAGPGDLLLRPDSGTLDLAAVQGDGAIRVLGTAGGTVGLGAVSGQGVLEVALDGFGTVRAGGVIGNQRTVQVSRGNLQLGNLAHSFTGPLRLIGLGTVTAAGPANLGGATASLSFEQGGLLTLTTPGAGLDRAISTSGGIGQIVLVGNGSHAISASISGDGGIGFDNASGRSLVQLSAANSFSGGLQIGSGVILGFAADSSLGAPGGPILLAGGLTLGPGQGLDRPLQLSGSSATVSAAQAGVYRIDSIVQGSGQLSMGGNRTETVFVLTGNNSHTGGVRVAGSSSAGPGSAVLAIDSDARLGAASGALDIGRPGATLATTLPGTLRATADLVIAASRSTRFAQMTVDTQGFDIRFDQQTFSGLGITKTGSGTWRLHAANADASGHDVSIEQGRLLLGVDDALGLGSRVRLAAAGTLDLADRRLSVASLDSEAGSLLQLGSAGNARLQLRAGGRLDGVIDGAGTLVIGDAAGGQGALVLLSGANRFTGAIEVRHASLALLDPRALGAAGNALRLDAGTLTTSTLMTAPLLIDAASALQIGAGGAGFAAFGQSLIISAPLAGSVPLRIGGGSRPFDGQPVHDVRLAHAANSFVSDLRIGDAAGFGSAALGIVADGSLGAASNRLILGDRFFDGESQRSASGGLRAWDTLTLPAQRTLLLDGEPGADGAWIDTQGFQLTLQGGIGELRPGLGLMKAGAGQLVMNGVNLYTGLTQVLEGSLAGQGELQSLSLGAAVLAPGDGIGLLRLRGDLRFTGGGQLWIELAGQGHDALAVGGSVDLGSDTQLRLDALGGFGAGLPASQRFQLVADGVAVQGQFANVADGQRLALADGRGSLAVHYGNGQGLWLDGYQAAAAVPEPGSWALMLLGAAGLALRAGRRLPAAG